MRTCYTIFLLFIMLLIFFVDYAIANNKMHKQDSGSGFYYSRDTITVIRKSMPQPKPITPPLKPVEDNIKAPDEQKPIKEESPVTVPDPKIRFDVEIRDGMALYNQSGWFDMTSHSDNTGLMLVFPEPTTMPIVRSSQYSPVDILSVDKQGKIIQIVPNILLSELEDNIIPQSPILAYIFLRGNLCQETFINVGDEVEYSIFKKPPVILNTPPPKEPPPPNPPTPIPSTPIPLGKTDDSK